MPENTRTQLRQIAILGFAVGVVRLAEDQLITPMTITVRMSVIIAVAWYLWNITSQPIIDEDNMPTVTP